MGILLSNMSNQRHREAGASSQLQSKALEPSEVSGKEQVADSNDEGPPVNDLTQQSKVHTGAHAQTQEVKHSDGNMQNQSTAPASLILQSQRKLQTGSQPDSLSRNIPVVDTRPQSKVPNEVKPQRQQINQVTSQPANISQSSTKEKKLLSFQGDAETQSCKSGSQTGARPKVPNETLEESREIDETKQKLISVLILAGWWNFSTVTRSIISNLREVDPEAQNIKITCAVLEMSEAELRDADKNGVKLRGPKMPMGKLKNPKVQWLDKSIVKYYAYLAKEDCYDFIIGNMSSLANGAFNLAELCSNSKQSPKVILMAHTLPIRDTSDQCLMSWITKADAVFSVGPYVSSKVEKRIKSNEIRTDHKLYLPGLPLEFLNISKEGESRELFGDQNIIVFAPDRAVLEVSGLDFQIAVISSALASQKILAQEGKDLSRQLSFSLSVIGTSEEEKDSWEESFNEFKKQHEIEGTSIEFKFYAFQDIDKLIPHLKTATVFISPQKLNCPHFCSENLVAMAAGKPNLVSSNSGMATLLQSLGFSPSIVWDNKGFSHNVNAWAKSLIQKIKNPQDEHKTAMRLRKAWRMDPRITVTHWDFIKYITDSNCIKVEADLEAEPLSPEHVTDAVKCGVLIDKSKGPIKAEEFVVAYLKKLLISFQSGDISRIPPEIYNVWEEVLCCLEDNHRKVVGVGSEDVIFFTLFCPSQASVQELQDENFVEELTGELDKLLKSIGIKGGVKVKAPGLSAPDEQPRWSQDHAASDDSSEGYATMKINYETDRKERPCAIQEPTEEAPDVQEQSEGYETMSKAESNLLVEISSSEQKTENWLSRQPQLNADGSAALEDDESLSLCKTVDIDYLNGPFNQFNKFSVSETGKVGIACRDVKPGLSVLDPSSNKPNLILSHDKLYRSAIFVKQRGQEYLAATIDNTIELWDLEAQTATTVYTENSDGRKNNLCRINDKTIACEDGSSTIQKIKTDSEKWKSGGTIIVDGGVTDVLDMCFMKTETGTPCLLLCCPGDVKAIDIVGGHRLWQSGEDQMGMGFYPVSVCVDENNVVLVADAQQNKLHMLSAEDGFSIKSVGLHLYGITSPVCIRAQNEFMFVEHLGSKHSVSIFRVHHDSSQ